MAKISISQQIEAQIVDLYNSGKSTPVISENLKLGQTVIYNTLKRNGVARRSLCVSNRKYKINENFFDNIDTEEKAYFLGFLYADGSVSLKKSTVTLGLQETDIEILLKLTKCIEYERPVTISKRPEHDLIRKDLAEIKIYSKYMSEQLVKLGCNEHKTYNLDFPKWLDRTLYPHFVRGFFDGDGCVTSLKNGRNPSVGFIGTESFMRGLREVFSQELNLSLVKIDDRHKSSPKGIREIHYVGRLNCRNIKDWMYKDSTIYLQRKYDKFIQIESISHGKNYWTYEKTESLKRDYPIMSKEELVDKYNLNWNQIKGKASKIGLRMSDEQLSALRVKAGLTAWSLGHYENRAYTGRKQESSVESDK